MRLQKTGIIPYYFFDGELKGLFMQPSNPMFGGEQYQIAKGGIESDLSLIQNVLKEGREELGLREDNIDSPKFIISKALKDYNLLLFIVKVIHPDHFDNFHYETKDIAWLSKVEYWMYGRKDQRLFVKLAYNKILEMENKSAI